MENNFTPINIEKLRGENNRLNTILLLIATVTMAVLAVMLFILIKKKIENSNQKLPSAPIVTISPTERPSPTIEKQPTSLPSPTIDFFPTGQATISPIIEATESAQ